MTDAEAPRASVLVVDDEEGVRTFVADALSDAGHAVTQADDGEAARALLAERSFHLVLTDLSMPRLGGMGLLREIRHDHPEIEVIVLTAHGSISSAVEAMREGAFDYLQKPVSSPAALRIVVARALERHRLRALKEIADGGAEPPLGYGAPAMRAVEQALRKVAPTNASVLLLGESGTGKEVAARALHRLSARAAGPFVAVNCAALSASLLESELFGHEKGAFTGAHARQRGRLELADGGTFFLDEVGELALELQAKLLRVVQEKRFERVGGRQTVHADVRWIAATNRNLAEMVKTGAFREDLYHRLSVFPVRLPALRERRDDIGPLAERLLGRIAAQVGRPELRLSPDARAALMQASWPGNVRELANVLERSAILSDSTEITADDLALLSPFDAAAPQGEPADLAEPATMSALERDAIARALAATGGNRRLAAARLGIGLRTLYEKLKRYGLG
jgi:two-component system, NtrC family, response regulator AtoC